jgi:hypothetical protein
VNSWYDVSCCAWFEQLYIGILTFLESAKFVASQVIHNLFTKYSLTKSNIEQPRTTVTCDANVNRPVTRLLQVARGTDWEGAILAGYTTGMRLQDVTNLRWKLG